MYLSKRTHFVLQQELYRCINLYPFRPGNVKLLARQLEGNPQLARLVRGLDCKVNPTFGQPMSLARACALRDIIKHSPNLQYLRLRSEPDDPLLASIRRNKPPMKTLEVRGRYENPKACNRAVAIFGHLMPTLDSLSFQSTIFGRTDDSARGFVDTTATLTQAGRRGHLRHLRVSIAPRQTQLVLDFIESCAHSLESLHVEDYLGGGHTWDAVLTLIGGRVFPKLESLTLSSYNSVMRVPSIAVLGRLPPLSRLYILQTRRYKSVLPILPRLSGRVAILILPRQPGHPVDYDPSEDISHDQLVKLGELKGVGIRFVDVTGEPGKAFATSQSK